MTALGLLGWALAGSVALVIGSVAVALAVLIIGMARSEAEDRQRNDR